MKEIFQIIIMKPITLSYLSVAAFIALLSLVASAPVIDSDVGDFQFLGLDDEPQQQSLQFYPPRHQQQRLQKKWSRLEPSIRFFKRSSAPAIPLSSFDLGNNLGGNEYFIVA